MSVCLNTQILAIIRAKDAKFDTFCIVYFQFKFTANIVFHVRDVWNIKPFAFEMYIQNWINSSENNIVINNN